MKEHMESYGPEVTITTSVKKKFMHLFLVHLVFTNYKLYCNCHLL